MAVSAADFESAIKREIDRRVHEAVEAELVEMKARVERRVRDEVGQISAQVARCFEISADRQRVVVTVNFPEG